MRDMMEAEKRKILYDKSCKLLKESNNCKKGDQLDIFEKWEELNDDQQYELVCETVSSGWNFPTISIVHMMKHKFKYEFEKENYLESALTLLQSQALALRHQTLHQYFKRLQNNESDKLTEMQQSVLSFTNESNDNKKLLEKIQHLPKHWRIVQLSVDDQHMESRFKKTPTEKAVNSNFALKLVTIECGTNDITVHKIKAIPNRDKMPSLTQELQEILDLHVLMYRKDLEKDKYKQIRSDVDSRMESLIRVMEEKWLGYAKVLLLGRQWSDNDNNISKHCENLQKQFFPNDVKFVSSGRRKLLHKVLDGFNYLTDDQIMKAVLKINLGYDHPDLLERITTLGKTLIELPKRHPTVLILDKEIQGLPWESLVCLQKHPITRIPSIHQLMVLHLTQSQKDQSVPKTGIRQDKIFYVLNPDQNLAKTQARLEPTFASMSIKEGITGEQPSYPQMKKVLSEMDAFIYCGHGSTLTNFSNQEIDKLNARAVPLLFGCNSGKLERLGRQLDPIGTLSKVIRKCGLWAGQKI